MQLPPELAVEVAELQRRLRSAARRQRSHDDRRPRRRRCSPTGYPRGRLAAFQSIDLQLAARDVDAIAAGDCLGVLGDIHLGNNPLVQGVFAHRHPDPQRFLADLVATIGDGHAGAAAAVGARDQRRQPRHARRLGRVRPHRGAPRHARPERMASDFAPLPRSGLDVQLCGDAHLEQLRRLRLSRARPRLRSERLRRDAARPVRVGREAARRKHRDCGGRKPEARRRTRAGPPCARWCIPTARRCTGSRRWGTSRSGMPASSVDGLDHES